MTVRGEELYISWAEEGDVTNIRTARTELDL